MAKTEAMLTTVDNPFDPFTQFNEWNALDQFYGYHTSALLARVAQVSHSLSSTDYDLAIEQAIDEIVKENVLGVHRKVVRTVDEDVKE